MRLRIFTAAAAASLIWFMEPSRSMGHGIESWGYQADGTYLGGVQMLLDPTPHQFRAFETLNPVTIAVPPTQHVPEPASFTVAAAALLSLMACRKR
jgi:hypothetical protein